MDIEKQIKNILDKTPIALRPIVRINRYDSRNNMRIVYQCKGLVLQGSNGMHGVALSYECDNMAKTLLHECLHISDLAAKEDDVEIATQYLWRTNKYVRDIMQERVVKELYRRDL